MAAPLLTAALVAALAGQGTDPSLIVRVPSAAEVGGANGAHDAGSPGWGHSRVAEVRVSSLGAASPERLRQVFGVAADSLLSREAIRRGVQALMATGEVEDVTVSVEETSGGIALVVDVQVASRVRAVRITGLPRRSRRMVAHELALARGGPLKVAAFEAGLARAVRRVREDGYPEAELDPDLDFDLEAGTVTVGIEGRLGAPRTVRRLTVAGVELGVEERWKITALKVGRRLTSAALEGARRRLAEELRRRGWWEAVVAEPAVEEIEGGVAVHLSARLGPRYELELNGIDREKVLEREALPFVRGLEPFSETALEAVAERVRRHLQRRGFLLASVDATLGERDDGRLLTINADPGRRTEIVAVRFPGATEVDEELLGDRVGVRRGHPWRWGGEPVDDTTLAADAASVLATLRELGFSEAEVATPRIVPEGRGVGVEIPIVEGPRYTVAAVELRGLPDSVTVPTDPLTEGGPWSLVREEAYRETVLAALREAGYADAEVSASHTCEAEVCRVVIEVRPGRTVTIDRIVLAGLAATHPSVVRKMADLEAGRWIGPEEQLLAQRRLLSLGIFKGAALRTIAGQDYGPSRGMVLELDEAASRAVSFGIGWNTEDNLRLTGAWSELNLFGRARSISLETTLSAREQRYQVSYREPARLGLLRFPSAVAVYRSEERFADYNFLRRGMWVELGDRQRRPRRLLLRYDYQIVRNDAPDEIKSELERDKLNIAIASITPILELDTRDDVFVPRRGIYASLQYRSAFKVFQADVRLDKVTASVAGYQPLGPGVLAVALRGGGIEPRGRTAVEAERCDADNCLVPIAERFFAGGRLTHRAFPTDLLGIAGETLSCKDGSDALAAEGCEVVAVGGAGQLLVSAEWRVPVWGPIGASVFVDGGNVWPSWRAISTAEMRWGAGLGVRVMTPVGPFRLEYAWKLDRLEWESRGELFLSFGNPF